MKNIPTQSTSTVLQPADFNEAIDELENIITGTGISLSSGDLNQVGKAVAAYAAGADFYVDSGAADAYVLSAVGSKQAPEAYFNGMRVRFRPTNANTGASTINVNSLGVKNIKLADGSADPLADDIGTATDTEAVYDGTSFRLLNIQTERVAATQGVFVDRGDPAAADFDEGDLTADAAWHDLNLAGIIPVGAKTVAISVVARADGAGGKVFALRKNGNSNELARPALYTQVINQNMAVVLIVAVDSDRKIEYELTAVNWVLTFTVNGWWN